MSTAPEADAGVLGGEDLAGRVVRGGMLRAAAFAVVNLLGVASSVVLLRHLGVADFGRYGTVIALVGIATGLADAGLNVTGSRELSLLPPGERRRRLLGALLGARLLLLVGAGLAAVGSPPSPATARRWWSGPRWWRPGRCWWASSRR
jgi:O-antigen/teichoic acid export membrane protein